MLTQEDLNLMYNEDSWGVYKYNIKRLSLVNELINFTNAHSTKDVCLSFSTTDEQHERNDKMFDLNNLTVYLFYRERNIKIHPEIINNDTLASEWYDSDCYDLDSNKIKQLALDTSATKKLLKRILKMNKEFDKLVYPIKTEK